MSLDAVIKEYFDMMPGGTRISIDDLTNHIQLITKGEKSETLVRAYIMDIVESSSELSSTKGSGIVKDVDLDAIGVIYRPKDLEKEVARYIDAMPAKSRVPIDTLTKIITTLLNYQHSNRVAAAMIKDAISKRSDVAIMRGLGVVKLR